MGCLLLKSSRTHKKKFALDFQGLSKDPVFSGELQGRCVDQEPEVPNVDN